jgi:membrane protein implicated in regulation of membrane protease activity
MEFLTQLTVWHWLIAAVVLMIMEVLAPGAFFLWLGVAAAVVGLLLAVIPVMTWQVQVLLFSVLSVASVIGWRAWRQKHPVETESPTLNRRGMQYVGRVFTLSEAIVNGVGKVYVDDTTWRVSGPDLEVGANIKVIDVDGTVFRVEAVD